jgi:hypothetical protein
MMNGFKSVPGFKNDVTKEKIPPLNGSKAAEIY